MEHPCKHAFSGHDAVPHRLINLAMAMTFLADLGHFKQSISTAESGSYRQGFEIKAFHQQVFAKSAILYGNAFFLECPHFLIRKEAHLSVPITAMGVTFQPEILNQAYFSIFFFCVPRFSLMHTAIIFPILSSYFPHGTNFVGGMTVPWFLQDTFLQHLLYLLRLRAAAHQFPQIAIHWMMQAEL